MLARTLEPEIMDNPAEAREYHDMDHSEVNRRFVADLLAGGSVGPDVLDYGTGTAQIPCILCKQQEEVRVMAADAAVSMLEIARYQVELDGVVDRVQLVLADAKDPKRFPSVKFHTVISNSLVHHLPDPLPFFQNCVRVLLPGGRIFIRDLLRPSSGDEVEQLVKTHAAGESELSQQLLRQSLHAALSLDELRAILRQLPVTIPDDALKQTSDRHWTLDVVLN